MTALLFQKIICHTSQKHISSTLNPIQFNPLPPNIYLQHEHSLTVLYAWYALYLKRAVYPPVLKIADSAAVIFVVSLLLLKSCEDEIWRERKGVRIYVEKRDCFDAHMDTWHVRPLISFMNNTMIDAPEAQNRQKLEHTPWGKHPPIGTVTYWFGVFSSIAAWLLFMFYECCWVGLGDGCEVGWMSAGCLMWSMSERWIFLPSDGYERLRSKGYL